MQYFYEYYLEIGVLSMPWWLLWYGIITKILIAKSFQAGFWTDTCMDWYSQNFLGTSLGYSLCEDALSYKDEYSVSL